MSKDAFVQFCESLQKDGPLLDTLGEQESEDAFARLAAEKGRAAGFDFDEKDAMEVIRAARQQRMASELTDAELQGVSGGLGTGKVAVQDLHFVTSGNVKWKDITLKRGVDT